MRVIASIVFLFTFLAGPVAAQEVYQEFREVVDAEVQTILSDEEVEIFGTGALERVQEVEALLTSGTQQGEVIVFENDLIPLVAGDRVYLNYQITIDGIEYYTLKDTKRLLPMLALGVIFILMLLALAGWQGLRALTTLGLSIGAILGILIPLLLAGYNPALVSVVVAGLVLTIVLFGTHGVNPRSLIAFLGTFSAVCVTSLLAYWWVGMMRLTGFAHDASVYLNFATGGTLDFAGLLLGSIIIGVLGVLDDVSITQASVTQQLKIANPSLGFAQIYRQAIKVGKDHIGSLVNTLALAYVGVSLPLVLLLAHSSDLSLQTLNQEFVAAEFLRIVLGSIGLILAVPLTTAVGAWWFGNHEVSEEDVAAFKPSPCGHAH